MGNLEKIIETYGIEAQVDMAVEECSELIKALMKNRRKPTDLTRANIVDELADVQIMLNQLYIIYDCREAVNDRIVYKIARQLARITDEASGIHEI